MNREPIFLAVLRYLMLAGLLFFMGMLYWSSLLIEEQINLVKSDLSDLKNTIDTSHSITVSKHASPSQASENRTRNSHIDPSLPNLLKEDPFYNKTLPNMLGENFHPKGIRKEAILGKPNNLHPFTNWSQISALISLSSVSAATNQFGKYETYAPDMAIKMEERKNKETGKPDYWIHLRDDIFWQPLVQKHFGSNVTLAPHFLQKHQVTAKDFKFLYDVVMNPHVQDAGAVAMRNYLMDIENIEIVDDFTFIVRWKTKDFLDGPKMRYIAKGWTAGLRPLASFVYQYFPDGTKIISDDKDPNTYRTNSIWAQNFARHWASQIIVSCGAWTFDGMTDRMITFKRNDAYYDPLAALTEGIEFTFKDSPDAIWQSFKAGEIDEMTLSSNQLLEYDSFIQSEPYKKQLKQGMEIHRLNYFTRAYAYLAWNEANSLFKSKKVRQALTMAIDRKRIVNQILNGMGVEINGTFFVYSSAYDNSITPWPFDTDRARTLLAEEGWYDSDGDGIIDKEIEGKRVPFRFNLTYFVKNSTTKAICEYIVTALKEVGIGCNLNGVDLADLSAVFEDKSFDALSLAWALPSPPDDPRQIWSSAGAKEKGSSNAIGFSNAEIDQIIDQLDYAYDEDERVKLYHRFDAIIHDEQPYTFLYTPKASLVYRDYLQNVFIPADRQDLIPGADIDQPSSNIFWLREPNLPLSQ